MEYNSRTSIKKERLKKHHLYTAYIKLLLYSTIVRWTSKTAKKKSHKINKRSRNAKGGTSIFKTDVYWLGVDEVVFLECLAAAACIAFIAYSYGM